MTLQEDYQVQISAFSGPLDLLLYLIRRAEVDIHEVPIAQITDQYLSFLNALDDVDVDLAGEFLVVAATLVEMKSRTLTPTPPPGEAEAGATETPAAGLDPRTELVQQLLAYQRYRVASETLDAGRLDFGHCHPRRPVRHKNDAPEHETVLELDDVHVLDIAGAYERIMESIDFSRLGDHTVEVDDTPIALHQEDLLDRLNRSDVRRLTLQQAFNGLNRGQRIGLFLATLELVRLRRVTVIQDDAHAPIEVVLVEDGSDEATERRSDEGVA